MAATRRARAVSNVRSARSRAGMSSIFDMASISAPRLSSNSMARTRFAEAALLFLLGLMAGVVGVFCHWIIEARIDRTVLGS